MNYHGKSQLAFCYDLLTRFCEKVFVSSRADQRVQPEFANYPQIIDKKDFEDMGPISGILSAFDAYKEKTWIVLACDLPFVNEKVIKNLIENRNERRLATAYISVNDQLPEPLCAIYEPKAFDFIKTFVAEGRHCPRKFLINHNVELIEQMDTISLNNVNDKNELDDALKILHAKNKA